jgi:uncharacterized repeat protein (TIGR03833 family)
MDGKKRSDIYVNALVDVVQKKDQTSGNLTQGQVKKILTSAAFHPHGIKVMLDTGEVGRVQRVYDEDEF